QALVDLEAVVEVGIVDEALPAHRGARLLEVHPHHDLELAGEAPALRLQALRVLARGRRVVDRAGADDHDQPVVHAVDDAMDRLARLVHQPVDVGAGLELPDEVRGRGQLGDVADAEVVGGCGAGGGVGVCRGGGGGGGDAHRASCGGVSVGLGRWRAEKKTAGRRRRSFRIRVPCLLRTRSRLVPPGAGKAKEPKVGKEAANHGQAVYEDSPGDATAAYVTCSSNSTPAAGFRSRARPTTGSPSASLAGSILPGPASQSRTARARSRARSASWLSPTGTVASNALAFSET